MQTKHKYNKQFIMEKISEESRVDTDTVRLVMSAFEKVVFDAITENEEFRLQEFGIFKPLHKEPRKRRNPKTGEILDMPELMSIKFTPSEVFRDRINADFLKEKSK